MANQLTTRARAEQWRRTRLLAGAPAPQPRPCPVTAMMEAEARQFTLYLLLGLAFLILLGALLPPHTSLSLEPAPLSSTTELVPAKGLAILDWRND